MQKFNSHMEKNTNFPEIQISKLFFSAKKKFKMAIRRDLALEPKVAQ